MTLSADVRGLRFVRCHAVCSRLPRRQRQPPFLTPKAAPTGQGCAPPESGSLPLASKQAVSGAVGGCLKPAIWRHRCVPLNRGALLANMRRILGGMCWRLRTGTAHTLCLPVAGGPDMSCEGLAHSAALATVVSYSFPVMGAGTMQLAQLPSQERASLTLGVARGLRVFNTGHFVQAGSGLHGAGAAQAHAVCLHAVRCSQRERACTSHMASQPAMFLSKLCRLNGTRSTSQTQACRYLVSSS